MGGPQLEGQFRGGRRHHQRHCQKAITAAVNTAGFVATETFMSKTDARAWMEMVALRGFGERLKSLPYTARCRHLTWQSQSRQEYRNFQTP